MAVRVAVAVTQVARRAVLAVLTAAVAHIVVALRIVPIAVVARVVVVHMAVAAVAHAVVAVAVGS